MEKHWSFEDEDTLMERLYFDFLSQIESEVENRGLSQKQIAGIWGISESHVSQIFSGFVNVSFSEILSFAKKLGFLPSVVLYRMSDKTLEGGPVHPGVFLKCWEKCGKPRDIVDT